MNKCEMCGELFQPTPRSAGRYCGRLSDRTSCKWNARRAYMVADDQRRREQRKAKKAAEIEELKKRLL